MAPDDIGLWYICYRCQQVSDVGFAAIGRHCRSLQELNLDCCFSISDKAISQVNSHTAIHQLHPVGSPTPLCVQASGMMAWLPGLCCVAMAIELLCLHYCRRQTIIIPLRNKLQHVMQYQSLCASVHGRDNAIGWCLPSVKLGCVKLLYYPLIIPQYTYRNWILVSLKIGHFHLHSLSKPIYI